MFVGIKNAQTLQIECGRPPRVAVIISIVITSETASGKVSFSPSSFQLFPHSCIRRTNITVVGSGETNVTFRVVASPSDYYVSATFPDVLVIKLLLFISIRTKFDEYFLLGALDYIILQVTLQKKRSFLAKSIRFLEPHQQPVSHRYGNQLCAWFNRHWSECYKHYNSRNEGGKLLDIRWFCYEAQL